MQKSVLCDHKMLNLMGYKLLIKHIFVKRGDNEYEKNIYIMIGYYIEDKST